MSLASHRHVGLALFALVAVGYLIGRDGRPDDSHSRAIISALATAGARDTTPTTTAMSTLARPSSEPLPPVETPLQEIYPTLVARARAGDAAAARRVAVELLRCHARRWESGSLESAEEQLKLKRTTAFDPLQAQRAVDQELERIERNARLCAQIHDAQTEQRGEWLLRAAELGDDDAAVCYAAQGSSLQFAPTQFSDAWFATLQHWRERAGPLAQRALDHGYPGAYGLFRRAYLERYLGAPSSDFSSTLDADPVSAYAYESLALLIYRGQNSVATDNERATVEFLRSRVDSARARTAERWAEQRFARDGAAIVDASWESPCALIASERPQ
jgi:hypothetical protein